MSASAPDPERDDWVEKVVHAAGKLGFNEMRLRWKLIRWQERRRQAAVRREQRDLHVNYAHKTCGECGAVQDRDEATCTSCGAKLGKRGFQVLRRLGIALPAGLSVSALLAFAIVIAYARVWIAMGGGFHAPSGQLLVDFGGRWPPAMADEPWRVLTSAFLHIGWMHLGFNLLAIASIGPHIERWFGRTTMLGLFVVTGVLANVGALQVGGLVVSAGASGGIMGLIGVAAGAGHRLGTRPGLALRNDMLKWSAYTFAFGFVVGADNWAHLFGGLSGAVFGLALRPATWRRRALRPARILVGGIGVAGTIAAVAIILTRQPSPPTDPEAAEVAQTVFRDFAEVCRRHRAGDDAGAIEAAKHFADVTQGELGGSAAATPELAAIVAECDAVEAMRARCSRGEAQAAECRMYQPIFDALPPPTTK